MLTWLGSVKYATHHNLVDFGIFAQTTASAFGCFCNAIEGSHWAFHFSPILYLPGALLLIWKSPIVLIALQAAACALAAPPVYALVRAGADVTTARLAALVVLLYPPLAGLAFVDFHENGFAPAAVAWLLWAFDADLFGIAAIFALVTLAVKEDQAIFLAVAGAAGALVYRRSDAARARFAMAVCVASVLVAIVFFAIVQPHANVNLHWQPTRFYAWGPTDWRALVPAGILERVGFLMLAFAPLAFVPFRSRWLLLAIVPFAEVLLSRMSTTFTMGTHYAGAWIGYVLVAFAIGLGTLGKQGARRALGWALALCVLSFVAANPLHPGMNLRRVQSRDVALDAFLRSLPPRLDVATQEEAYTHLALWNPNATLFPEIAYQRVGACWLLVDRDFPASPRLTEPWALQTFAHPRGIEESRRSGAIVLYRRLAECSVRSTAASSASASTARGGHFGSAVTTR